MLLICPGPTPLHGVVGLKTIQLLSAHSESRAYVRLSYRSKIGPLVAVCPPSLMLGLLEQAKYAGGHQPVPNSFVDDLASGVA